MNEDVGNAFAINKDDITAFVGVQEVAAVWTDSMHEGSALFGNEDVSTRISSEVGNMMVYDTIIIIIMVRGER